MPDPVAHAINTMLDHIHAMDDRINEMCKEIKELGGKVDSDPLPELESCEIKGSVDEHRNNS